MVDDAFDVTMHDAKTLAGDGGGGETKLMATAGVQNTAVRTSYKGPLATVTTLFFMWGFVTVLNDILVPHLKSVFNLNYAGVMLVQFAFFSAYLLFSIPSAKVIDWIGYKKTMVVGLFIMALGALMFVPAASGPSYQLFLAALMVLAAGITVLQVAANPYVAVLGPPQTASSRLNLAQAFNSVGTTLAPYLGGLLILGNAAQSMDAARRTSAEALQAYRIHQASSVKAPYLFIGLGLIALGIAISAFKLPPIPVPERDTGRVQGYSLWRYRHLVLGIGAIFLYVGAEVSIGSFLVSYFVQPEIGHISAQIAAKYVSFYWGGAMVGRFIGSAILQKARTETVLGIAAIAACTLVGVSALTSGSIAMWSIIAVGLFNSVMFPSIFTLAIAKLGPLTGDASGLLVTAIVGGAILPVVQGMLADHLGIQIAFVLPAICYVYIVFYAFKGSRPVVPV